MKPILIISIVISITALLFGILLFTTGYALNSSINRNYEETVCTIDKTFIVHCIVNIDKRINDCYNGIVEYNYEVDHYANDTVTTQTDYNITETILEDYLIGSNTICYYNKHHPSMVRFHLLPTQPFLIFAGISMIISVIGLVVFLVSYYCQKCQYEGIEDNHETYFRY